MNKNEMKILEAVIDAGEPRPDVAAIFLAKSIIELQGIIDLISQNIFDENGTPLKETDKVRAAMQAARDGLGAALKAARGRDL